MYQEAVVKDNKVFCPVCGALNMTLTGEEQMRNVRIRCRKSKSNSEHYFIVNVGEEITKIIEVDGQKLVLKYSFEAAEQKELIQGLFKSMTNVCITPPNISKLCSDSFYAGLLSANPLPRIKADEFMRAYMKIKNIDFESMFGELKELMQESGFYNLSGLSDIAKLLDEEKGIKDND